MAQVHPELPALLGRLTPQQQETFLAVLQNAHDDESLSRELQRYPDLLKAVEAAVAVVRASKLDNGSADVKTILQELRRSPKSLQEMPYRIELCRRALAMAKREEDAASWAYLHFLMASSLVQSPEGSRAANIEEAIAHCDQALTVYTARGGSETLGCDPVLSSGSISRPHLWRPGGKP
jgi:hypothetical protein